MSRRYGRNQKRRHRSEISALTVECDRLRREVVELSHSAAVHKARADQLRGIVAGAEEVIKSVLGRNSALLPPIFEPRHNKVNPHTIVCGRMLPIGNLPCDGKLGEFAIENINLHSLEFHIRRALDNLGTIVHLRCGNGESSSYYLSDDSFVHLPVNRIVNEMLPELARKMVAHLKFVMNNR